MNFLPSKRFGITAVLILAAFAGWFFIFGPGNKPGTVAPIIENPDTQNSLISIDSTEPASTPTEEKTPTDTSEEYLRLEGIVFPPSRVERADETAVTSTSAAIKIYGVALAKALTPYSAESRVNEVELALSALEKGSADKSQAEILGLKAAVETHRAVGKMLGGIDTPESLVSLHAMLITSVSRLGQLVLNMSAPFEDPILTLASAEEYATESRGIKSALIAINDIFTQEGITFSDKEKIAVVLYEAN